MSEIVGDTGCPKCRENGGDKTANHLIMFEDGGAYCNRCGYRTNWKEEGLEFKERTTISDEELAEVLEDFQSCPIKAWPTRKLREETCRRFGFRTGVDPKTGDSTAFLMPVHERTSGNNYKLTGVKVRLSDQKKMWCQGRVRDACLIGQHLLPKTDFNKLYICEAPIDMASVYQAIKDSWKGTKWAAMEPNVVSLPHGTGCAVDVIDKQMDVIKRAKEVILVFDSDNAGKEAVDAVRGLLPDVKTVRLPSKDANDMLQSSESAQLAKLCLFSYESVQMDGLFKISDCLEEIVKKPTWGMEYPWPTLTELTYGIRPAEVIGFAGGVGIGKSEVKYQIVKHLAWDLGKTVAVFDLEATRGRTGKAIVGKVLQQHLHKPDEEYDEKEVEKVVNELDDKVLLYDHRSLKDWARIKTVIRHAAVVEGATVFMIDPLTALVAHLASSEANDALNSMMGELASLALELNVTMMYFAHLNPPKTGNTHERGGKVLESQLTGSRAMIKWSHYIIGLERNKDPDIPVYERNMTKFVLLKDREFGNVGQFKVYWDSATGNMRELGQ